MEPLLPLESFIDPTSHEVEVPGVEHPVASVMLSTAAVQLSHPLDFQVTPAQDAAARIGALVKVKVSGKEYTGVITARKDTTAWHKPLNTVKRVMAPWPLLDERTLALLEEVSLHYGAGPAALLRYVLPARRVKVEQAFDASEEDLAPSAPRDEERGGFWECYPGGQEFLDDLAQGKHPRAVLSALPFASDAPHPDTERGEIPAYFFYLARILLPVWRRGEQSLLIFPSAEQAQEVYFYLARIFSQSAKRIALYTSTMPPSGAYRSFLQARFGKAAIIVGTRQAVFLPLLRPGLFFCWDNSAYGLSSDMFPNFSARQVLLIRTTLSDTALLFAHFSVSAADLQLVQRGFARKLEPSTQALRTTCGHFKFLDLESQQFEGPSATALLPSAALRVVRQGLRTGPVLVLVPPDSKFSVVSCVNCATNATCPRCAGPLHFSGSRLVCSRCSQSAVNYVCPVCKGTKMRGRLLVSRTVIEDIGRMFPNVPVVVSRPGPGRLERVDGDKRLVIANSGGEPCAVGGYSAAVILRAHMLASRTALWTGQEIMRRFLAAGALVRPGGDIFLTEPLGTLFEQSLARWDPWGAASADLRERQIGHFAPAWRTALLRAKKLAVYLESLREAVADIRILGPVVSPANGEESAFVSTSLKNSRDFGCALRSLQLKASQQRDTLMVEVDPVDPGGQVR